MPQIENDKQCEHQVAGREEAQAQGGAKVTLEATQT